MFLLKIDWVSVSCNNTNSSITTQAHSHKVHTCSGLNNFDYFVKSKNEYLGTSSKNIWELHLTIFGRAGKIRVETQCISFTGGWNEPDKSPGWTGVNIGLFCNKTSRNIVQYLRIFIQLQRMVFQMKYLVTALMMVGLNHKLKGEFHLMLGINMFGLTQVE